MHHNTIFSPPVLLVALLLVCQQVSSTLLSTETGSIAKSIAGSAASSVTGGSSSAAAGSAASSGTGGSLGAGEGGSSASSAAGSSASAGGASSPLVMLSKDEGFSKSIGVSSNFPELSKAGSFSKSIGVASALPDLSKDGSFSKSIRVSSALPDLSKAGSFSKSIGVSSALPDFSKDGSFSKSIRVSSALPDLSKDGSFSKSIRVSSPLGVLSKDGSISKRFSFTGPEVRPLPPPGRPNPIPNPVPNPIPLPLCTPNPEYIVVPQYIPASGSMFANVPVVTLFTNAFLDHGYSNDITRELFDLSGLPIGVYANFIRRNTQDSLTDLGVEDASSLAQWLYQSIKRNFGCSGCPQLSLAILIRKIANEMAHILYVENLLTLNNAKYLGLAYAQAMADSGSVSMTSDPTSKLSALFNGFANFLQYLGLFTKEKAHTVIFYIGTEYYRAASVYRWW